MAGNRRPQAPEPELTIAELLDALGIPHPDPLPTAMEWRLYWHGLCIAHLRVTAEPSGGAFQLQAVGLTTDEAKRIVRALLHSPGWTDNPEAEGPERHC